MKKEIVKQIKEMYDSGAKKLINVDWEEFVEAREEIIDHIQGWTAHHLMSFLENEGYLTDSREFIWNDFLLKINS